MKLYEINKAIEDVINNGYSVDEETGEILFTSDNLEQLEIDRNDKIEGVALSVKNYKALAEDIKREEANLKARRESALKKAEWLENFLSTTLCGLKFESPKVAIGYRKSSKVVIADGVSLPEEYIKTTIKIEPDKIAIKNAIKSGAKIPGCSVVELQNIQIK